MRIIDLLNKIANGEEVPKKIFYSDKIWYWDIKAQDYVEDDKRLFNYYMVDELMDSLNEEVEIIEEDKKIYPLFYMGESENEKLNMIKDKINEIIDIINRGGKE